MADEYTEKLENVIKQMLQPIKEIPFKLVVEAMSGHKVLPFEPTTTPKDQALLDALAKVAKAAGQAVNNQGIVRNRPNEVGNDIEPFVRDALRAAGFHADTPTTLSGKKKTTGYPDLHFQDKTGRDVYLECKSFNIQNVDTTQRSFYVSPSEDFKVSRDAVHLGLSYEIIVVGNKGRDNIYNARQWKVFRLDTLQVDVKYEFNSDNRRMYAKEQILAHGMV